MTNKSFATMKTNVGTDIQDTSDAMKTIIGVYLNNRYFKVLRAMNWEAVNDDHTIAVTATTQSYTMETDFRKELYVVDTTNGKELAKVPLQYVAREHPSALTSAGSPTQYSIFTDDSGNRKMKLYPVPATALTLAVPYIISPTAMSVDADEPILDFADLLETGAKADAWRYKKQFQKASIMEALFEKELSDWIWDNANETNEVQQAYPSKDRITY